MPKPKLIRITTISLSLELLLEGQLEFMQNHFEVVAISADKEELERLGKERGYETYHVEMTRQITPMSDLKAVYKLYRYFKKEKPTIVHTHTPKAGIVGMMAAWLAGVPHRLHTVAGLPLMEATGFKRKVLDFVEKLTYRWATAVYPNSKVLYDFILSEKLTKPRKLKVIGQGSSNGIDTQHFNPILFTEARNTLRKELHIPEDSFVFVFVGRLVGDKGINELVKAFQKLNTQQKAQSTTLLLVGFLETELDPLHPEVLEAIETNSNIVAVGYQPDVRPYLAASDALAFPSYREGFPNVVMQAGAMGLPAIVTNINGCNEIIVPNVNGLIIPPKNPEALKEAMQEVIISPDLYQNLQRTARDKITSRYERHDVWEALLATYQALLDKEGKTV